MSSHSSQLPLPRDEDKTLTIVCLARNHLCRCHKENLLLALFFFQIRARRLGLCTRSQSVSFCIPVMNNLSSVKPYQDEQHLDNPARDERKRSDDRSGSMHKCVDGYVVFVS